MLIRGLIERGGGHRLTDAGREAFAAILRRPGSRSRERPFARSRRCVRRKRLSGSLRLDSATAVFAIEKSERAVLLRLVEPAFDLRNACTDTREDNAVLRDRHVELLRRGGMSPPFARATFTMRPA